MTHISPQKTSVSLRWIPYDICVSFNRNNRALASNQQQQHTSCQAQACYLIKCRKPFQLQCWWLGSISNLLLYFGRRQRRLCRLPHYENWKAYNEPRRRRNMVISVSCMFSTSYYFYVISRQIVMMSNVALLRSFLLLPISSYLNIFYKKRTLL